MFPDKPIFTYIGMALAVVAMVLGVVLPEYANYAWTVAALLGFGSVTVLRQYIESKGYKTVGLFAVVIVITALQLFGVVTPEIYQSLMAIFLPLFGITYQQALSKAGALKKAA